MTRTPAARVMLVLIVIASSVRAEESPKACVSKAAEPPVSPFVVMAIRHGNVLGPSGAVGTMIGLDSDEADTSGKHVGMLIRPEIGLGGIKLDIGAAQYTFGHFPIGGIALSSSWLHAWGAPGAGAEPGSDYIGAVGEIALFVINFEIGGYSPLDGPRDGEGLLLWSVGLGF